MKIKGLLKVGILYTFAVREKLIPISKICIQCYLPHNLNLKIVHRPIVKLFTIILVVILPFNVIAQNSDILNQLADSPKQIRNRSSNSNLNANSGTLKFSLQNPYFENESIYQDLYTNYPYDTTIHILINCKSIVGRDSIDCYNVKLKDVNIEGGHTATSMRFEGRIHPPTDYTYINAIKKFNTIPTGAYVYNVELISQDFSDTTRTYFIRTVDSNLSVNSSINSTLNKFFDKKYSELSTRASDKDPTASQLYLLNKNINNKFKGDGIVSTVKKINHRDYAYIYYYKWFLGRYQLGTKHELKEKIKSQRERLDQNPDLLINDNPSLFTSTSSNVKDIFKTQEDKKSYTGFIETYGNYGNGREPGSEQDNNYQELRGQYNTRILNIPVGVEGYYTTQDIGRTVKASYFRLHYDVEEMKSSLSDEVNTYKSKYNEAKAKQGIYENAGRSSAGQLNSEKARILSSLKEEYNIKDLSGIGNYDGSMESFKKITGKEVGADELREFNKKIDEIKALSDKLEKTKKILQQYDDALYFDSALVYEKVKDLGYEASPKELARAAEHILPDSKKKKFLAGLTNLDIGILNEYESEYTMAGQNLKGGKLGYDFNFAKLTTAIGKTEYISRAGYVDRYNSYMLRADIKTFAKQNVGLIYYVNSPTRQIFESSDFKKDINVPTFKSPTHIFSLVHKGEITKGLNFQSEVATSYSKMTDNTDVINKESATGDNLASTTSVGYNIPNTGVTLSGEWEHMGKDFKNDALPYIRTGTDRYTLSGKTLLFRSFLAVGVQYNLLKQQSFASTGYNKKWGFDIRTKSKRYPNVYLSYKPYSTFRTFTDTLNVQQRPVFGEVWLARGMYRIRKNKASHNFFLIYNKNSGNVDTLEYNSSIVQLLYNYTSSKDVISIALGKTGVPTNNGMLSGTFYSVNTSYSRMLGKSLSCSIGQEVSYANYGLQRIGFSFSSNYTFRKLPVSVRCQTRYSKFKMDEYTLPQKLWSIGVGLRWNIKYEKY